MVAEKYGIPDIATGDIFRWAISGGTPLGLEVKEYVESGSLVPDELTIEVVRERLSADDCSNGWLIDGFPRSIAQAEALDEMLSEAGTRLDAALVIEVPEDVSVRRLLGRRVCSQCGRNYHVDVPPANNWTCDVCGGEVVERTDDHEEAMIRHRLGLYHELTEPLKAYYSESGLLREIDGLGSPEEVFARIVAVL
jgi:adenylate kinase